MSLSQLLCKAYERGFANDEIVSLPGRKPIDTLAVIRPEWFKKRSVSLDMLADLDDPEIEHGEYQERPESKSRELSALEPGKKVSVFRLYSSPLKCAAEPSRYHNHFWLPSVGSIFGSHRWNPPRRCQDQGKTGRVGRILLVRTTCLQG